jgi:hypothetical protein
MAAPTLADVFQIGVDILRTTVTTVTKKIVAQTGSVVGKTTDADNVEWWQHVGFTSRPPKPHAGKAAAQAVVIRQGGIDVAISSQDLRGLDLYGELADGETAVYAPGETGTGQARSIYKADGSIHHYTRKGNTSGGAGMTIQMDADAGAIRMTNSDGFAIIIDSDGIVLTAGAASLTLAASGNITLVGTGQTQVDGAGILLGALGLPGLDNAITGPAGIAGKPSPKVLIGSL